MCTNIYIYIYIYICIYIYRERETERERAIYKNKERLEAEKRELERRLNKGSATSQGLYRI